MSVYQLCDILAPFTKSVSIISLWCPRMRLIFLVSFLPTGRTPTFFLSNEMPACQPFCGHAKPGNCLATQRVRMHQCGTYPCRFVFVCVEILSFNTFWNIFYCEFIHLYVHEITSFGMVGSIAYPNMWNGRPPNTWRTNLFWPDYTELFSTRHIKPVCLGGLSRSIKCCTYASHDFP